LHSFLNCWPVFTQVTSNFKLQSLDLPDLGHLSGFVSVRTPTNATPLPPARLPARLFLGTPLAHPSLCWSFSLHPLLDLPSGSSQFSPSIVERSQPCHSPGCYQRASCRPPRHPQNHACVGPPSAAHLPRCASPRPSLPGRPATLHSGAPLSPLPARALHRHPRPIPLRHRSATRQSWRRSLLHIRAVNPHPACIPQVETQAILETLSLPKLTNVSGDFIVQIAPVPQRRATPPFQPPRRAGLT
jgi:hypothetical protein